MTIKEIEDGKEIIPQPALWIDASILLTVSQCGASVVWNA